MMSRKRETSPDPSGPFTWVLYHLKKDWPVLRQALLGSICVFAVGAALSWLVVTRGVIPYKDAVIQEKDSIIESRDSTIAEKDKRIAELDRELEKVKNTPDLTKLPIWVDKTAIKRPLATNEELNQDIVIGKTVFVSYLPVTNRRLSGIGPPAREVYGKTFQDCDLIGPAIITIRGEKTVVEHCELDSPTGSRLESRLLLTQDHYTFGVIPFNDCGMLNCKFINIGFAGNDDELQGFKEGFKGAD